MDVKYISPLIMPIKPENAKRYPPNWKELRRQVLQRAGHKCEQCGVPNHWLRNNTTGEITGNGLLAESWEFADGDKATLIVLTIAHLDHDELETQDITRLRAWCQKCHLAYDHEHHMMNSRATRKNRKAVGDLFA